VIVRRFAMGAALAVLVPTSLASSALASRRLHLLVPSVVAFSSDGARDVAWEAAEGGPLVVLDTISQRRKSLAVPAGCRLSDEGEGGTFRPTGAAGRFLLDCAAEKFALLDTRTGLVKYLPGGVLWYRLGVRYARGNNAHEHQVIVDLATGAVRRVGEEEAIDLDRPGAPGERAICQRLRSRVRKRGFEQLGNFSFRRGLFVHGVGNHGDVEVDRCRGRPTILRGQFVRSSVAEHAPRSFDLRSGLLTWDTGLVADASTEGEPGEVSFRSRLDAVRLRDDTRVVWALPRIAIPHSIEGRAANSFGYSTHTANAVFWIATRTLEGSESGATVGKVSIYFANF
jgi:hypothetical protein